MTADEDTASVRVEVPVDVKAQYKATHEHGELSQDIRKLMERKAFGAELSTRRRAERRLDTIEEELHEALDERGDLDQRIETLRTERAKLQDRLNQLDDREDAYEDALDECSAVLYGGGRLFPGHGRIRRAANIGGVEPDDVIEDIRDRHPEAPDHAFVEKREDPTPFDGITRPTSETDGS